MSPSEELFHELMSECADDWDDWTHQEVQDYIIGRAHEMCRNDEIDFDMFGRVVDEALCW